jgi:hypothetical protein
MEHSSVLSNRFYIIRRRLPSLLGFNIGIGQFPNIGGRNNCGIGQHVNVLPHAVETRF